MPNLNDMKTKSYLADSSVLARPEFSVFNSPSYVALPGFADVHVHFREPGFSYKETIASGSKAAAHGGYTAVCTMPNLNPVPDCLENLAAQTEIIARDAVVKVYPYASITKGEHGRDLVDFDALSLDVVAFSDDGRGVQDAELMRTAMTEAARLGKMIVAHCEQNELLRGGYIHDGRYAKEHGHRGICSESEYAQVARDIELCRITGCAYHVCHISTKESVELIRRAKAEGLDVTCETAPHYLVLCEDDLQEDGRFKMNPPLRSASDRDALLEGLKDGTIDMIATDHAPHSIIEKSKGLKDSPFGIVGLEIAFPLLYTKLVKTGFLSLEELLDFLVYTPRRRFSLPLENGDFSIWDLNSEFIVNPAEFLSQGQSTPFEGENLFGRCMLTVCDGKVVYEQR